jgi:hypothetical protein
LATACPAPEVEQVTFEDSKIHDPVSKTERAKEYLRAIELGAVENQLAIFSHPDVQQIE